MNLPIEYLDWINSIDTNQERSIENGLVMNLYSQNDLQSKYSLATKFFQSKIFINDEIQIISESVLEENPKTNYLFNQERVNKCITIGESNNNFVFVDPYDNYSIWVVILVNKCVFNDGTNIYDFINLSRGYKS